MTSKLIVNSLAADTGVSTITFADQAKMGNSLFHSTGFTIGDSFLHSTGVNLTNVNATGVITATKFVGEVSVGSSITFEDNEKAYFGTSTDFSIYHNGSASYLDETGTGGLIAKTNTAFQVFNSAGSQPAFTVTPGGSVELYHGSTKRIESASYGALITGQCYVSHSGTTPGFSLSDNGRSAWGASDDLQIYHQSSDNNSYIKETGGGSLVINADDFYLQNNATTTFLRTHSSGAIDLNYGGSPKLQTTSSGITVTGGITANANSSYSASIVFSQSTGIRLSHTNQYDGNDGTIAAGTFDSGLNIVGTRTTSSGNRQIRMWGDVFPSTGNTEKLGLSNHRWSKLYVNQILFGGDTAVANELDDYEEGTWTPLVRNSSGTGTAGAANYGYYTKVGNVVHAHATVHWTALNSGTTSTYALLVGFPFTSKNATNYRCQHILGAQVVGVQAGGDGYNLSLAFDGNLSSAYLLGVHTASTSGSNYTHTPTINSSGTIYGLSITYLTDS